MTDLTLEEQRYLMAAFAASPREWFRPKGVDRRGFPDGMIDQVIESLTRQGLMDGQADYHARLTDRGRKEATQLDKLARRDWGKFYKRRRMRIAVASTVVGLCGLLIVLKWNGLL